MKNLILHLVLSVFLDKRGRSALKTLWDKKKDASPQLGEARNVSDVTNSRPTAPNKKNIRLASDRDVFAGDHGDNLGASMTREDLIADAVAIHREKQGLIREIPIPQRTKLREVAMALLGRDFKKSNK